MFHTMAEYANVLAARLWFRVKNLKSIAEDWEISEDEVSTIQGTEEYHSAVETLMRTTRSPHKFLEWIESSGDYIPSGLAERMGLPEKVILEMVNRVEEDMRDRIGETLRKALGV